jgi:uncharacterized protein DUF5658
MIKILSIFVVLQVADLATTAATLKLGGVEINPLVHTLMIVGPMAGLVLAKLAVVLIAIGCALMNKPRALQRANLVFAGIVVWNISIIARLLA